MEVKRKHRVETPPQIEETHGGLKGLYEADGTRYTAWVYPVKEFCLQCLGCVDDGFLVVNGLNRLSYLFNREGYLDISYLMEKFKMNECDTENFKTLLLAMMPERS